MVLFIFVPLNSDSDHRPQKRCRTQAEKTKRDVENHPLREPCTCSRKCIELIPQRRRIGIWIDFWKLSYYDRKNFIHQNVHEHETRRHINSDRNVFFSYTLKDAGQPVTVCRVFFLATLGYSKPSCVVNEAKKTCRASDLVASPDMRGKHTPSHALDTDAIDIHIKSYNPGISHYRREHAPKRLYLPHELSVRQMVDDYNDKNCLKQVSYASYLRRIRALNISFAKLGTEECELCDELSKKEHDVLENQVCQDGCRVCVAEAQHKHNYVLARNAYHIDGSCLTEGRIVRSVDLQKVIMLPRMPGMKSVCFTPRIIGFHETFAPVGKYMLSNDTVSVLWHEGIAGRKCEEIASTFLSALYQDRDFREIIYYADNCAAQNKNWALFTTLVEVMSSGKLQAETLTLKFLEKGHTFMSADEIGRAHV